MRDRLKQISPIVLIGFIIAGPSPTSAAARTQFKAGLGYDFISQEYFADSVSYLGGDSAISEWALKTDYLDDIKGTLSLQYLPYKDRRIDILSTYEQTSEFLRLRLNNGMRLPLGENRLDIYNDMELKRRIDGETVAGDDYYQGYARARYTLKQTENLDNWVQLKSDFVSFDSVADYNYNYFRYGAAAGLSYRFGSFSSSDFSLFYLARKVADSSDLDYDSYGAESSTFGFHASGEYDLFARFERKDYQHPTGKDDQYRLEFQGRNKMRIAEPFFMRQVLEWESTIYDGNDDVNQNYSRTVISFLQGIEFGSSEVAAGPTATFLSEESSSLLESEDYTEWGAELQFDHFSMSGFFLSAKSVTGRRDYDNDGDFFSDYLFERVSLIGDLGLMKHLNLSLFYSAEWEWHDLETDDSRIDLLSTNLTYTF
ncbi:MAG: hypothetical protein P1R58_03115 [bacterium]|nr:hypothetical protein [bacterium]